MRNVIAMQSLTLEIGNDARPLGTRVLEGLLMLASTTMGELRRVCPANQPVAALSRVRGTGRGVHFSELVSALERDHPITLQSPFEGSALVAGGVWVAGNILSSHGKPSPPDVALAKLRWSAGADDLPLHVHDHSDRVIIVLEGRGYFHLSEQTPEEFDGQGVRSVPARERDVFAFSRGLLHTFSTQEHAMTLLSCQMPYLAFDDPDQYRLPSTVWTARANPEPQLPKIAIDPAWSYLLGGS
jgi:mannose-6-phosphate isomerase-like protein (cupin superfamily)